MTIKTDDRPIIDYLLPDDRVRPGDLLDTSGGSTNGDALTELCFREFGVEASHVIPGESDIIRIPAESIPAPVSVTYNGVRYLPEVPIRDTLPPVEIFDHIPALAVEVATGRWDILWLEGQTIWVCSKAADRQLPREKWNEMAGSTLRCRPCERGDIFAAVAWPEEM